MPLVLSRLCESHGPVDAQSRLILSTGRSLSTRNSAGKNDFEGAFSGGIREGVVGLQDVVHGEAVSDELTRLELTGVDDLQEHWCCHRVHQACGERNVAIPEFFHMEFDGFAMDADVGDAP